MKRPSQTASWLAAISIISVPLMVSTFDKEVDRALRKLGSHDHSNPVMVSEPGVNLNRMRLSQG
jgi:hypothetical protein